VTAETAVTAETGSEPVTEEPGETIGGLPMPLHGQPASARVSDEVLAIEAGPATGWFADPGTGALTVSAPALLGSASGDFLLAARVQVAFAGAGPVRLGFEAQSPAGQGCEARFSGFRFEPVTLGDLRDGT
jgi:regulation of enolase protein 1 (concanavalin A-like superfamily)